MESTEEKVTHTPGPCAAEPDLLKALQDLSIGFISLYEIAFNSRYNPGENCLYEKAKEAITKATAAISNEKCFWGQDKEIDHQLLEIKHWFGGWEELKKRLQQLEENEKEAIWMSEQNQY